MNQVVSARELPSAVQTLVARGNYQGASQLVIGFMNKGYVDYGSADQCWRAALQNDDIVQIYALGELAVKIAPKDWRSWQLLYQAYHADARWGDALQALVKVGKLSESVSGEYYLARAEAYERLLQPGKALSELERLSSLKDAGTDSRALLLWANIQFQQRNYEEIRAVLPQRLNGMKADRYTAGALKTLGRACDALKRYSEAFAAASRGNEIQAGIESRLLSANAVRRRVEVFRSLFTEDWVKSWPPVAHPEMSPVFMLGFPRSGTTLLEQVLDAHPGVQAMEEPPTITTVLRQATALMQAKAIAEGGRQKAAGWKSQWLSVMKRMASLDETQVAGLRKTYYEVAQQEVKLQNSALLLDKMPLNTVDIGLILRIFPNARFIVSLRHPCDCVLSGYMQNFKMNDAMANFLDLENAASFYSHVMNLLWQYEDVFELKERMHFVRYEDLVMDLEAEARKVLDFLGLPWDENVLKYDEHAQQRGTLATPSYQGVTQKIYDSSKERWRNYADWMEPVLPHFYEAAERYGYDLSVRK